MAKVNLRYVKSYEDRHGRLRHYFRRGAQKQIALRGLPGSREFMAAYQAALSAAPTSDDRAKLGSLAALCAAYYVSAEFKALQPQTRRTYRAIIERFSIPHGELPVAKLEPKHIRAVLDKIDKPGAANNLRKRLRGLMQFAVERDWRRDNPVLGIKKPKYRSIGFIPWTEEEITAFETFWPSGSRERLALALTLYTGQRRSDVVKMGRQHVKAGRISVVQQKTGTRLSIKIHPRLQAELAQAENENDLTFVMTQLGKPFSGPGFSAWFSERAALAGVPNRAPHGLRKAAARRLAEAGCTAHEIASITGHKSLDDVELYTRSVNQQTLGDKAVDALVRAEERTSAV